MIPKAKPMALAAAFIFEIDRCAIGAPIFAFGTVWILSKLAAQVRPTVIRSSTPVLLINPRVEFARRCRPLRVAHRHGAVPNHGLGRAGSPAATLQKRGGRGGSSARET